MRALRILRRITLTVLALLIALFAFIQIQQRLLRRRAERLHAEIVALQLHPGTFADIQRLQKEWGRHAHYKGECTPHHCIYQIGLYDVATSLEMKSDWLQYHWIAREYLSQPYSWSGGRRNEVTAEIRVRQNVMWGADFSLLIEQIAHHPGIVGGPSPSLISVRILYGPRLFSFYPRYSGSGLRRRYTIGVLRGAYARIKLSPRIGADSIQKLNRIDFECLTRFHSCVSLAELIPDQWNEYLTNQARQKTLSEAAHEADLYDCTPPLSLLALEAQNIALVEYLGKGIRTHEVTDLASIHDLLRPLSYPKNGFAEKAANVTEFAIPSYSSRFDPFGDQIGKRFILLYSHLDQDLSRRHVEQCAVFPDSPENEKEILEGIAMDPSVGEPYGWTG